MALENVLTGYVFLSDIDFLPATDTYSQLKKSVQIYFKNSKVER
jgi:hypothetical protein